MTALSLSSDRSLIPSSDRSVRYALLTLTAPASAGARAARPPVDVAFVLDRSGSMQGEKLVLSREAIITGAGMLGPDDRFAIIAYDDEVTTIWPLSRGTRQNAEAALRHVEAGATTNLSGGWLTGCMQLAESENPREIRKCLLMSDGQANVGIRNADELASHATELRARGILTSTFGVGTDFDEELMTGMARAGGGQSYFIEHARQTEDLLTTELGETLDVVERDVVLRLSASSDATLEMMSDFVMKVTPTGHDIAIGNLVSGQSVSILVKLEMPKGELGRTLVLGATVVSKEQPTASWTEHAWTYADDAANEAQARNSNVDAEVAKVEAARARREALRFNRRGDFLSAGLSLRRAATALHNVGTADAMHEAAFLTDEAPLFARAMAPKDLKRREYQARSVMASRDPLGKARRKSEPESDQTGE